MSDCIRYSVDTELLNAGVPIEQLDKTNVRLFKPRLTYKNFVIMLEIPSICLLGNRGVFDLRVAQVDTQDYLKIIKGQLVVISTEIARLTGKSFKLINKQTGDYMYRDLHSYVIDAKGIYWGYWVKYVYNN